MRIEQTETMETLAVNVQRLTGAVLSLLVTPSPVDPDALISEEKAAAFLGVEQKTIQKWRQTGDGPKFVRLSKRCVRYSRTALIEWCKDHTVTSTSSF